MCKRFFSGKTGKVYVLGIFLVCGMLLTSVDDCESMYLAELEAQTAAQAKFSQGLGQSSGSAVRPTSTAGASSSIVTSLSTSTTQAGELGSSGIPPTDISPAEPGTAPFQEIQGKGNGEDNGADFLKPISGKEWKLVELRLSDKIVLLDRAKLKSEGSGDFFTMTLDKSRVSGKAAPNRYSAPYQAGPDNTLTFLPMISTLMATSFDPERLQEREYYQYLAKVKSWKLNQKMLELLTADANNKDAVLVYSN
jgi:hypothetical protein